MKIYFDIFQHQKIIQLSENKWIKAFGYLNNI